MNLDAGAFENEWALLNTREARTGRFRMSAQPDATEPGLYLAVDEEGLRHILIPIELEQPFREDRRSGGVQVLNLELESEGIRERFVDVVCRKPQLNELFCTLTAELVQALQVEAESPWAVSVRLLERWRELLSPERGALLGEQALIGLWGELATLEALLDSNSQSLDVWQGPRGGRHDFRRGDCAVEIKSTTRRDLCLLEVHGIEQLEAPNDGELVVFVWKLERVTDAGRSVPDLVRSVMEKTTDSREFTKLLQSLGYHLEDSSAYETMRFDNRAALLYPCDESFPKLVPASLKGDSLPPGVFGIRYQIDLTGHPVGYSGEAALSELVTLLGDAECP